MNLKIYDIKYFTCKFVAKLSIFSLLTKKKSIFLSKNYYIFEQKLLFHCSTAFAPSLLCLFLHVPYLLPQPFVLGLLVGQLCVESVQLAFHQYVNSIAVVHALKRATAQIPCQSDSQREHLVLGAQAPRTEVATSAVKVWFQGRP